MDERLRRLQREAASGDPEAMLRYRHAVKRATQFGTDYRTDESQPPSRQKMADLLSFYGIKHIIVDSKKRDCNWNGHVVVLAPCRLSRLFLVISGALHGARPHWQSRISEDYDTEVAVYYLLVEHYYHGRLRTDSAKTWLRRDTGLEALLQLILIMDAMEQNGSFIGPLESPYQWVRNKFVKWIMKNLDEGIEDIVTHYQESLEAYPKSVRYKASLFFWETLNEYDWGIDDLLEIYHHYLIAGDTPNPKQFKKASLEILEDYGMQ